MHEVSSDVSRETEERLQRFADLLRKWSSKINLVSARDIEFLWDRHIRDCLQLLPLVPQGATRWVDMGSGGGLPGVVLGCVFADGNGPRMTMIESDQRKATFLRTCIRELNLRAEVISERVERVEPQAGDVVSARALAALPDLLPWVHRHLAPDGVAILPKGRTAASEIAAAQQHWHFDLQQTASAFGDGSILVLRDIQRAA